MEEHERDLYAKQDMVNDLWNKMNTTDNRGENALNNLYADREDLERRLADIPFDYVDPALLRQEWESVNDQIRSANHRLQVEIERLGQLIRGLEDKMYTMDRDSRTRCDNANSAKWIQNYETASSFWTVSATPLKTRCGESS